MSEKPGRARNGILDLEELARVLKEEKAAGKKVVHCHGVFDLLHIGHIRHLEQAKSFGDLLVVTLTPDRYVNKGPGRPAFGENLRAEAIAALACVDYVAINKWPLAVEAIRLLCPEFYVKGPDYKDLDNDRTGGIRKEEAAVKSVGGRLRFTEDITFSASSLINQYLPVLPKELSDFLSTFSARYTWGNVFRYLEGARPLKVLLVGETIVDEYVYCETMGKSGKEPILAARQLSYEKFAGGIVAVANHVAALCDHPSILTVLGRDRDQEEFLRQKLDAKVQHLFLYQEGDIPFIVKRRYIEAYPFQKLFEVYLMEDGEIKPSQSAMVCKKLEEVLPNYDLVIVTDYGHGMIGPDEVEVLCRSARFLAINTQVNAGNMGYNTVSKYRRCDFICVSEREIRLEVRSRRRPLRDIVLEVSHRLCCDRIIITRGESGCLCYSRQEGFSDIPAFSTRVVDRVGAGDAVFSIAALCAVQGAPIEITGVIGNAVGAQAVAVVGNRSPIQRLPLIRHIETLLK